jgi:hypothetical protein
MSERCNCTTPFTSAEINLECIVERTLTDANVCFAKQALGTEEVE